MPYWCNHSRKNKIDFTKMFTAFNNYIKRQPNLYSQKLSENFGKITFVLPETVASIYWFENMEFLVHSVYTCVDCDVSADGLEIAHRPRHCAVVFDYQRTLVITDWQTDVMYCVTTVTSRCSLTSCPHWSVTKCAGAAPVRWRPSGG